MRLLSLQLKNFRNYETLTLDFPETQNLIVGKNGQGKTNLLEAIYFLSHSRSNRTGVDRELIRFDAPFSTVSAVVSATGADYQTKLDAQITLGESDRLKTLFKLNGSPLKSRSQILGHLPTVSFFLTDLLLLRGTPEDRRRWLDAALVQYDKRHFTYLSDYQKIRTQKNRLLKQDIQQISADHLDVWNQQLAEAGGKLMASRLGYLLAIQEPVALKYADIAAGQEALTLAYQNQSFPEEALTVSLTEQDFSNALYQLLQQRREDEIRRATCLVGPHRDDIIFRLSEADASAYASQGQQRSVVLALKLTELNLLAEKLRDMPILLLDDVMAELDPNRQALLLDRLDPSIQVFLTTTHLDQALHPLAQHEDVMLYQVTEGQVVPQRFSHSREAGFSHAS